MIINIQSNTDTDVLLKMLRLGNENATPSWKEEELGEIFDHQLSIPVASELNYFVSNSDTRQYLIKNGALGQQTFREVLTHSESPLEALTLVKEYSKACMVYTASPLPKPIYSVLYYASIAAALSRHNRNITTLNSGAVRCGFLWSLAQTWIDPALQSLFEDGLPINKHGN